LHWTQNKRLKIYKFPCVTVGFALSAIIIQVARQVFQIPQPLNPIKTSLATITMKNHKLNKKLVPGDKICINCLKKVLQQETSRSADMESEYFPEREEVDDINQQLASHNMSPIKRKLSSSQITAKLKTKVSRIAEEFGTTVCSSSYTQKEQELIAISYSYEVLLTRLRERLKILTLVPDHWIGENSLHKHCFIFMSHKKPVSHKA
jgi:hypothetical protein